MPTTPVHIRTVKHLELDADTRDHVTERMQRLLTRLGSRGLRATVRFEDVNGPRGGVDAVCRVKIVLARASSIVIEARGVEWREAFDLAAARAQHAARRVVDAGRARRRAAA